MTLGESREFGRWTTGLVLLLLLSCGFYGSYRAVYLAITDDEVDMLNCIHRTGYARLFWADDWNAQAQFLNALLAKPCVELLPLNEIAAGRLPSLLGLALFLWGVWRIGMEFPSGATRVLITLALLSNAFLLDFFSLARGYGLAVGFTVLSLSFLMQASMLKSADDGTARRQAGASLWLAFGAALSNMGFFHFYAALLVVIIWLSWSNRLKVYWWVSALLLGIFYVRRVVQLRSKGQLFFGGDIGFVHDTVGSLVRTSFYDRSMPVGLVQLVAGALALLVLLLAYWSYRERIRAALALSLVGILAAASCVATHQLWKVKYPEERVALYLVPLVILIIGAVAAWSRLRWLRLFLWGLVLTFSVIGLQGANLSHTLTWRECAGMPSALLALREVHQQTGQDVMVAISRNNMRTVWYYTEHLLGLQLLPESPKSDISCSYLRTYDWLTAYEWKLLQTNYGLPPDSPLLPGTTHLLLSLHSRDDQRLLATPLPGGLAQLHFYPASDTTLERLIMPQHQGAVTFRNGQRYMGEFKHGMSNGQGTYTWPDGQRYVGGFKDGKFHGQGTYTWPDGQKYEGEFLEGQPDGPGKMTYPDGRIEDGMWKQGQFAGPAPH